MEKWIETEAVAADGSTAGPGRCTMSSARSAANRRRCPSSPTGRGRSTARTASGSGPHAGSRTGAMVRHEPFSAAPPACGRGFVFFLLESSGNAGGPGRLAVTDRAGPPIPDGSPPPRGRQGRTGTATTRGSRSPPSFTRKTHSIISSVPSPSRSANAGVGNRSLQGNRAHAGPSRGRPWATAALAHRRRKGSKAVFRPGRDSLRMLITRTPHPGPCARPSSS